MTRHRAALLFLICLLFISCREQPDAQPPAGTTSVDADIERAALGDSTNAALWQQLYGGRLEKGDTLGALSALRHYTRLQPGNSSAWLDLAWLLADRKDPGTVSLTDSLTSLTDPDVITRARYIRGVYESNIGMDGKAISIFDSIITANYTFIDAYIEKGIILHDQQKFAEALTTFQQALKINSKNAELYYWISRCYEGLGNGPEAEDWIRKYEALR